MISDLEEERRRSQQSQKLYARYHGKYDSSLMHYLAGCNSSALERIVEHSTPKKGVCCSCQHALPRGLLASTQTVLFSVEHIWLSGACAANDAHR